MFVSTNASTEDLMDHAPQPRIHWMEPDEPHGTEDLYVYIYIYMVITIMNIICNTNIDGNMYILGTVLRRAPRHGGPHRERDEGPAEREGALRPSYTTNISMQMIYDILAANK